MIRLVMDIEPADNTSDEDVEELIEDLSEYAGRILERFFPNPNVGITKHVKAVEYKSTEKKKCIINTTNNKNMRNFTMKGSKTMPSADMIEVEGFVTKALPSDSFLVEIETGKTKAVVNCKIAGKLRTHKKTEAKA